MDLSTHRDLTIYPKFGVQDWDKGEIFAFSRGWKEMSAAPGGGGESATPRDVAALAAVPARVTSRTTRQWPSERSDASRLFVEFVTSRLAGPLAVGGQVIDVAGGKGRVAAALQNKHGVNVVVIDPREELGIALDWTKRRHAALRARQRRGEEQDDEPKSEQGEGRKQRLPRHLCAFFSPALWGGDDDEVLQTSLRRAWFASPYFAPALVHGTRPRVDAANAVVEDKSAEEETSPSSKLTGRGACWRCGPDAEGGARASACASDGVSGYLQHHAYMCPNGATDIRHATASAPRVNEAEAQALLRDCTAVIALHPDQCTDDIVKFVSMFRKPFAIVPCCVFPNTFKRTLWDGTPVRTHDHLVRWVAEQTGGTIAEIDARDGDGRDKVSVDTGNASQQKKGRRYTVVYRQSWDTDM